MDAPVGYWKTKDSILILIADMSDKHLVNSINMLKRTVHGMHEVDKMSALDCLSYHGGEMAEIAISQQVDEMWDMTDEEYLERNEKYQELTTEAERRGLWQCIFIVDNNLDDIMDGE